MQRMLEVFFFVFLSALSAVADASSIDCSESYRGFETSSFGPYHNIITVSELDCLKNNLNGSTQTSLKVESLLQEQANSHLSRGTAVAIISNKKQKRITVGDATSEPSTATI